MPSTVVMGLTSIFLVGGILAVIMRHYFAAPASYRFEAPVGNGLAARYAPMARLLDERESSFMLSCEGMTKRDVSTWRRNRRSIFRGYLALMRKDFARIDASLRDILVFSNVDRPELVRAVSRARLTFGVLMLAMEGRLLLHSAGLAVVDIRPLVQSFNGFREHFDSLISAQMTEAKANVTA